MSFHCILHQENLCKAALKIKHIIDPVVKAINLIRSNGLKHRQFRALIEDMESNFGDILYHSSVRWLSLGIVLTRVWNLRNELKIFFNTKEIDCDFVTNIENEDWKYEFMFTIDIFEKLNDLNKVLQGKQLFAHEMYRHVRSFQEKLSLFSRQASQEKYTHFTLLANQKVPNKISVKIQEHLKNLNNEFDKRFNDFKNIENKFNLLTSPFSYDVSEAPDELQLELIDIQCNYSLKEEFRSSSILESYQRLPLENFPNFKNFAAKLFCIFCSTYICEQSFSCMKINKSTNRSLLTNDHLNMVMRISISNFNPDFKKIIEQFYENKSVL